MNTGGLKLRENEQIIGVVRTSLFTFFWYFFLAGFILLSCSFFLFWLAMQGWFGIAVMISCVSAVLAILFRIQIRRNSNYWIITSERLVDVERTGFMSHNICDEEYEYLSEIKIRRRGIWHKIFSCGDLVVNAADSDYSFILNNVRHPEIATEMIRGLSRPYRRRARERKDAPENNLPFNEMRKAVDQLSNAELRALRDRINISLDEIDSDNYAGK